ncbi:hypothetical protein HDU97_002691 [Phlyctochytrium planicorne]|nr:hypothetical protein HDU97_002691 [Phlyctochytrium planicorne]
MSTYDTDDIAFLVSATRESEHLREKVQADIKAFEAAVEVSRKIYVNLSLAHKSIIEFKQANPIGYLKFYRSQVQVVKKRFDALMDAEEKYKEIRKDAQVLIKLIPALESRLPDFRLKVPELNGESDGRFNAFQEFVVDKNLFICHGHVEKHLEAVNWLKESIESMALHDTMVKSDIDTKEMELNVFRMGCFELVAAEQGGRAKLDKLGMMKLLA